MPAAEGPVKSRREMYSEATRAALMDAATTLFVERGYLGTKLEDVATATQVTRGAVYHHFTGKQALFEAVLDREEEHAIEQVRQAATAEDPLEAALQALDKFLDKCCEPVYGKLCWHEAPVALGFVRWKECEEKWAYAVVEQFVDLLMGTGYLDRLPRESLIQFLFWMLGGAGIAITEAGEENKHRVRDEWADLMRRTLRGMAPDRRERKTSLERP